jgi:hypothetical protein
MADTPDADRADFVRRLQNYGLDESAVIARSFATNPSTVTRLSATRSDSALRPVTLRTNDFDVVRQWIGLPDRLFDEIEPLAEAPKLSKLRQLQPDAPAYKTMATRSVHADAPDAAAMRTQDDPVLARDLARAYIYGDSRKLKKHAAWLSKKFPAIDVAVWPMFDIVVKSGSVLEFGPGPNVVVAGSVTIEAGGKIRSLGSLKIDATLLQRTLPLRVVLNPALDYVNLSRRGGA